jgi:hypothetical protein
MGFSLTLNGKKSLVLDTGKIKYFSLMLPGLSSRHKNKKKYPKLWRSFALKVIILLLGRQNS